ncbi:MAG: ATP-binding domain-containing protein [Deltaproteobacteria bacterium]|jgi:DNA helicase-2/ATP-dependent DNA helicase PcrA|nr:ATP-binding domain-containing protein [Deltaproteobacteria bacterium]
MPRPVLPSSPAAAIIQEELSLWEKVATFLSSASLAADRRNDSHEAELIELRDAIAEAKPEDLPPLVEQMTRVSALAVNRRGKAAAPIDQQAPYFGHLRLQATVPAKAPSRDVLIGRRGVIDRAAGIQIVDWRDAPVSQLYYRYEEGDDYDEHIGQTVLQGVVEVRRSITITAGKLRRISCPQGVYFCDSDDVWWEAESQALPALQGGQGLSARAPKPLPIHKDKDKDKDKDGSRPKAPAKPEADFVGRADKHLPEIAALIDRHQFELISQPDSGVVVIQGGAGSGKTTVALHRVAYLHFQQPARFRGAKVMVIVPSEALVRYVSGVLPALGVSGVPVQTSAGWMRHHRKRLLKHLPDQQNHETPQVVSRLKKHPGMLALLEQYVADQAVSMRAELQAALSGFPASQTRVLSEWDARKERPLRLRCRGVRSTVADRLEPGLGQRIDELLRRLSRRAGDVFRDLGECLTDGERLLSALSAHTPQGSGQPAITRADVRELVEHVKAQLEEVEDLPDDVDPERFQAVDGRPLDEGSPAGMLDVEDDPLLLYLYRLKYGGLDHSSGKGYVRYEHMVIDEVQDLSVIEVKLLIGCIGSEDKHAGAEPSLTMAGDVAQRLVFDNGFSRWEELLPAVGLRHVHIQRLHIMYRSTAEVMQLAHEVLGPLLTDESRQLATRHGAPIAAFAFSEVGEAVAFLGESLRSLLQREPTASVALVSRHAGTATLFYQGLQKSEVPSLRRVARHEFTFAAGVDVTDVMQVKGLEFDYVVILDATGSAYPDTTEARHLLHIAITRCAHQLWLLAAGSPSPLLPRHHFIKEFSPADEPRPA